MHKSSKSVAYTNILAKYNTHVCGPRAQLTFFFFFKLAAPAALVQCRVVRVSTVLCNFNFSLSLCNIVKLTTSTEYSELDKVTLHPPAFQLDSIRVISL